MSNQESNYLSSDLTNPKYNYDLVVGTTAQAINATMKKYLSKYKSDPTVVWYGQHNAGDPVTPMDPIPGIDPFETPDGGTPPQALLDSDFVFAIKAGFGLPEGVDPLSVPDILILSEDRQKVTYQLFFNNFEIVNLDWGRHGSYAWKHFTQPEGNPYLFKFLVDMNFNKADPESKFADLPKETRDRLLDLNADTMFSVNQLYLDLNNAGLQNMPTIEGIPQDSDVYLTLQKDFINTYWKTISSEGKFIMGYAVKSNNNPSNAKTSIQPTSLNFGTSPHYDAAGKKTTDYKLYTLNYLMTTEDRELKVGGAFSWNWVRSTDVNSFHGAMAVRRELFANFLNDSLSQYLSDICIKPSVHINLSWGGLKWSAGYSLCYDSSAGKFTYEPSSGAKILSLNYKKEDYDHDKSGLISGHYKLTSYATGDVNVSGSEITLKIDAHMDVDFDCGDIGGVGAVKGKVGGYSSTTIYEIAVDGSGKLTVAVKSGYPKTTISPPDLDKGAFSGIDGVDGLQDKLNESYKKMAGNLDNYVSHIQSYINSSANMWVFPGGQTFIFKDAAFSNYQDLVNHITYSDPT